MKPDSTEAKLRKNVAALERKYREVSDRGRLSGTWYANAPRLKVLGDKIDEAKKELDAYLQKHP